MSVSIDNITERLGQIEQKIQAALTAIAGDGTASPVLKAVVEEFQKKAQRALADVDEAEIAPIWEHIIELEQAGDSARVAAQADPGIKEETKQAVVEAHAGISSLKAETKD